jgi:hypothetical protein
MRGWGRLGEGFREPFLDVVKVIAGVVWTVAFSPVR